MKQQGFTLIELMITITILGILAMIAYPSYIDSVNKSRRSDAHDALIRLHLAQERLRGNCRFYAGAIGGSSTCGANAAATTVAGSATSTESFYTIAVSNAGTTAYTLTATATGAQAGDTDCQYIILEVTNVSPDGNKTGKNSSNATVSNCW